MSTKGALHYSTGRSMHLDSIRMALKYTRKVYHMQLVGQRKSL